MKHCKYFFIVYAIAILFSGGANAADITGLATTNYVKTAINKLPAVARSGSYDDLSNKPTIPAAQVNSDWNATSGKAQILNKPTLGTMAAKDNVTNADISGTIDQDKITGLEIALSGKQATLTSTNVKGDGTTGNVVTGVSAANGVVTVSKGSITSANNAEITIKQNGTKKGSFTLNQSGAATIELTDNNTTYGIANANTAGLVKSGNDITVDSTTGVVTVTHATKADTATSATSATTAGSATKAEKDALGNVITSTYATKSELTNKQLKDNIVNVTVSDGTDGKQVVTYSKGDATSTDNYPSVKAANQIAAAAAANATMELTSDVATLQGDLTALTQTVENNKGAADNAIKALDSSVANANGAISTITITDGKITNVTRKSVDTADLAAGAVTPVKTSGVIGYIPSGSATSTSYAQIWVQ